MTEIPEHLLERSRARRAALGLGGDDAGAPAAAAAPSSESAGAAAPATTSAAPAKAAAAPAAVFKAPEIVLSPYAQAAIARKKIPFWAVPVLLFLPLWGFLYWGTLDPEPVEATGLAAEGDLVYGTSCASCHGAAGGGGVGPELTAVTQTFPDYESHVWWIVNGSPAVSVGSPYGSPDREGGQRVSIGGMPAWGNSLSTIELLSTVYHERELGGATPEELELIEAIAENPELPAEIPEGTSLDDIRTLLAGLVPEELAAEAAAAE